MLRDQIDYKGFCRRGQMQQKNGDACAGMPGRRYGAKSHLRLALVAVTLLGLAATTLCGQSQPQNDGPRPARSRAEELLDRSNDIGNNLVAMAQDFPEEKYDFKVQKDERTIAQNLLHAAALDFILIRRISGSNLGPDFGEGDNPSRDVFRAKAVVKFVQEAVRLLRRHPPPF
jgi:hypothetical protein